MGLNRYTIYLRYPVFSIEIYQRFCVIYNSLYLFGQIIQSTFILSRLLNPGAKLQQPEYSDLIVRYNHWREAWEYISSK